MYKYIWLGIRESDVVDTNGFFAGSITIFGTGSGKNRSMECEINCRIDHNGDCPNYDSFFQGAMRRALRADPGTRFIQYDPTDGVQFPPDLQEKFVFQNDYALLERLNNKISLKRSLETAVPVLPYVLLRAEECTPSGLREAFPGAEAVVVQRAFSCGGSGTFLLPLSGESGCGLAARDDEPCMVTAFQSRSISVNVHCVIYPEEHLLFPPSVQLIDRQNERLTYMGSDYSSYWQISEAERAQVLWTADTICRWLQEQGYLGVCGIDMLLSEGACYLMEINPRFQASSALLNRDLSRRGYPSLQEYHCDAFCRARSALRRPPADAAGSFITLHYRSADKERLMWMRNTVQAAASVSLCEDGLCWERPMEEGCYAFQIRCEGELSSVTFQHTLRLHPNVTLSPFTVTGEQSYDNALRLKLLLLARGVSITPATWDAAQRSGGVDWAEFCAVTVQLFDSIWVTAPSMEPWFDLSPAQIDADPESGDFFLRVYGRRIVSVRIMPEDRRGELQTAGGHYFRDVVYLNPDRLRVYHRDGCSLQDGGMGCQFCDLFGTRRPISFGEIREVLDAYWTEPRIEHYLIGGGSGLPEDEYPMIMEVAKYLHDRSSKHIYVMSHPIEDMAVLRQLYANGVTEVAFNIEVFDKAIAGKIMPGKSRHSENEYLRSLRNAVSVFGSGGAVRSAVLVGFDDLETFRAGIRRICETGASPMLSLFRPCSDTPLEHYMPMDENAVLTYFEAAESICGEYSIRLGPSCKACQNNVIAMDFD